MVIASRINATLNPTITQQLLGDAIKSMAAAIGLSLYLDTVSGSSRILVYEWVNDASKVYGKLYLRLRIDSTLAVGQRIFSNYDAVAISGTNGGVDVVFTAFTNSSTISIVGFNGGNEYKLICLLQGSLFVPLGILAPANRASWWDMNSYPYGFYFNSVNANILSCSALSPYNSNLFNTFLNNSNLASINPITGRPDLIKGLILLSQSNAGIPAASSADIGFGSFNGQTRFANVVPMDTSESYCILNNVAGGLAVRVG